jgi:murein DD-endopeptidase MepM/ murein hydrolase activator NlpD
MRTRVLPCESKRLLKVIAAALLAGASAACSGDSSRFGESPFTNPFSSAPTARVDRMATGSLPSRTAPIGAVTSQALPSALPRGATSNPLNPGQIASSPSIATQQLPRVASSTLQQASPIGGSAAGWSAAGGTPVTVGAGETASTLSARYGVPVSAITAANGGQIRPGQQAIIPVFGGSNTAAKTGLMEPARTSAPLAPAAQSLVPSNKSAAFKPTTADDDDDEDVKKVTPPAKISQASPLPPPSVAPASAPTTDGRITAARPAVVAASKPIPAVKGAKPVDDDEDDEAPKKIVAAAPAKPLAAPAKSSAVATPAKSAPKLAAAKPVKPVDDEDEDETPSKKAEKPAEKPAVAAARPTPRVIPLTAQTPKAVEPAARVAEVEKVDPTTTQAIAPAPAAKAEDKPEFRWPAKGRVISGFGSKGGNGDGIAIAVPEGTAVKAAEGGTVAYAGEELKGYGKLVLVRHDNGFVSAYAHNGELNVKRGEKVSRGQTIAKSGSTGNVTSPQLHFELRKGSTPVDPTKYLDN